MFLSVARSDKNTYVMNNNGLSVGFKASRTLHWCEYGHLFSIALIKVPLRMTFLKKQRVQIMLVCAVVKKK